MLRFLPEWEKETWTLAVAIIALVQPWIVFILKRIFKAGKIDIHESGNLEVGFGGYGATVGILGTLRSRNRDLFIHLMQLEVENLNDGTRHRFDWVGFRPITTIVGRTLTELEVKLPSGFMLPTSQPYQFNILFADKSIQDPVQETLHVIRQQWFQAAKSSGKLNQIYSKHPDRIAEAVYEVYGQFSSTVDHEVAASKIGSLNYWKAGKYKATLVVRTSKPNRRYRKSWLFVLLPDGEELLRDNPEKALEEACRDVVVPLNFLYPPYIHDNFVTRYFIDRMLTHKG